MEQEHEGGATVTEEQEQGTPETPEEAAAREALARAQEPPGALTDEETRNAARRVAAHTQRADDESVQRLPDDQTEAMERLRAGVQTTEEHLADATEWLLSDEQEVNTRGLKVRIGGTDEDPIYAEWVIAAIGVDVIRGAEREASGNRAQRRAGGGYDELKANLRVVAAATIKPDLAAAARAKGVADPAVLLERRFRYRSGVIAQIAGEVMSLSGFDAEDVRAAGN